MSDNKTEHLTIEQAAKSLGVSRTELDRVYKEGKTPAIIRDRRGIRRYSPLALRQARKALREQRSKIYVIQRVLLGMILVSLIFFLVILDIRILFVSAGITAIYIVLPSISQRLIRKTEKSLSPLTSQELKVLAMIVDGSSDSEIAKSLAITEDATHKLVNNIFRKLQVTSRSKAIEKGIAYKTLSGDTTTDAPPPDVRKKKKKRKG